MPEIDLLRAYSVLSVSLFHIFLLAAWQTPAASAYLSTGNYAAGVDLFFAISGYVISLSLHKVWEGQSRTFRAACSIYVEFIRKRFLRLWPACAFWATFCLGISFFMSKAGFPPRMDIALNVWMAALAYVSNFVDAQQPTVYGYFWSLSLEWQFYLLFPIVLLFVRSNWVRVIIFGASFALTLFWRPGEHAWPHFRYDPIICGIFAYMALNVFRLRIPFRSWKIVGAVLTVALLLPIIRAPWIIPNNSTGAQTLTALMCGLTVYFAAHNQGFVSSFHVNGVMQWIAKRSYSIYLSNIPAIMIVISTADILARDAGVPIDFASWWPLFVSASFGLNMLFADLSYRMVENILQKPKVQAATSLPLQPA